MGAEFGRYGAPRCAVAVPPDHRLDRALKMTRRNSAHRQHHLDQGLQRRLLLARPHRTRDAMHSQEHGSSTQTLTGSVRPGAASGGSQRHSS